jgi:adenylate cyclase class 2
LEPKGVEMYEIEVKAWDTETEKTEQIVSSFAEYKGFFDKTDVYYEQKTQPKQNIRLRFEKAFLENNLIAEKNLVTFKQKELFENGIEVSKETEFEVSDKNAFFNMLENIGFEFSIKKHKKVKSYSYKEFCIELVEIENLGNFIEIETIQPDESAETIEKSQCAIFEILDKCNIPKENIEKRYYLELLKAAQR